MVGDLLALERPHGEPLGADPHAPAEGVVDAVAEDDLGVPPQLQLARVAARGPAPVVDEAEDVVDVVGPEAHRQQHPVGHLAGHAQHLRARDRDDHRDVGAGGRVGPLYAEPPALIVGLLAPQQCLDGHDVVPKLGDGGRAQADAPQGAVAGADPEDDPAGRDLLQREQRGGRHGGVARQRVGDRRHDPGPLGVLGAQGGHHVQLPHQGGRVGQADGVHPGVVAQAPPLGAVRHGTLLQDVESDPHARLTLGRGSPAARLPFATGARSPRRRRSRSRRRAGPARGPPPACWPGSAPC